MYAFYDDILHNQINFLLCRCMLVEADVQMPSLSLESCTLHMEDVYVGVMSRHQITLHNNTVITTQYIWKTQVCEYLTSPCYHRV